MKGKGRIPTLPMRESPISCLPVTASHPIIEKGLLVRDAGGFALRRDSGGLVRLDLLRTPVDHVEKRVRISGVYVSADRMEVETIEPLDR